MCELKEKFQFFFFFFLILIRWCALYEKNCLCELMWGALSRLFVKNENSSSNVQGEFTEQMDKQAPHQDMDTLEVKQVSFPFSNSIFFYASFDMMWSCRILSYRTLQKSFYRNEFVFFLFFIVDFVTYLKYHLQFTCKYLIFVLCYIELMSSRLFGPKRKKEKCFCMWYSFIRRGISW